METTWTYINAVAERLGVKADARRKWLERNHIPYRWRLPILQDAAMGGIAINPNVFEAPQSFAEDSEAAQ